jgi:hypothetical protein
MLFQIAWLNSWQMSQRRFHSRPVALRAPGLALARFAGVRGTIWGLSERLSVSRMAKYTEEKPYKHAYFAR